MIKNYFKVAWRNLWRNKVFSIINILGLTLGMTAAILLILNIQYETGFDQFHPNKANIYKVYSRAVVNGQVACWPSTPATLAPALQADFPEIKNAIRYFGTEKLLVYGDKKLKEAGSYADAPFLSMFGFPLIKGNLPSVFSNANSIVLTESLAKKIFGDEDPINKIIRADNADNFTVTGILKDLPQNTQFKFGYLVPWAFLKATNKENAFWNFNYVATFVELKPTANLASIDNKIEKITSRYTNNDEKAEIFLHPLSMDHLYTRFQNGKVAGGNIDNVKFLGVLAIVMLLIACINFMNLSTARSLQRAREVGIRKVAGAVKYTLVLQFIGEAVFIAFISGIIALLVVQLLLPLFSTLLNIQLYIPYQSLDFWLSAVGFVLFTGLLAGSYPAFYLSSFMPVQVLKGGKVNSRSLLTPRKVLVVFQFIFAIVLINFTIVFQKQTDHGKTREIGFLKDALVYHPITEELAKNYEQVKDDLISSGVATSLSRANTTITRGGTVVTGLEWKGHDKEQNVNFELFLTDGGFVKANGLQLVDGRDIDLSLYATDTLACLINEATARITGFKNPVGEIIKDDSINRKIVGVVRDFLVGSPNQPISPALIFGSHESNMISIRLSGTSVETINRAEAIIKKYNPGFLTELKFANDEFAAKFRNANNVASLMNTFSLVAIFISCMGLFGLANYIAENKVKEIGIRKVLGAGMVSITALLSKSFIKLVLIAIVIATPLAWMLMHFFLQKFEYRTTLSWWIPLLTGMVAIIIALLTVSAKTLQAAMADPVKSLRTE